MKKVTEMEEGILILLQKLGCELDVYETTFVWACVCALSTLSYASEAALNADALPRTITRASGLNARSHLYTTYHIHKCKRTVLPVMSGPEQTFFFLLAAKLGTQGLRHFPIHSAPESLVFGIMPTWPKDYVTDLRSHKHMSLERSPWSKRSRAHQIWVVLLNAIKHWSIYAATVKLHHFGLVKPLGTLWTADVCVKGLGAIRVWHLSAIPNRDIDGYVYSVQRWALTRCCAVIISLRQQKHVAMSTAPARSNVFTMKQASSTPCPAPVRMFFSRTIRSWWYDRRRDGQLCPTCEETHLHYHRGANSPPIFVFSSMFDLIIEAAQWSAPE